MSTERRFLGLAGPTASGKSAAALMIAREFSASHPVEIISVDSAQVYRGMDIGTAKPSAQEQGEVPHHLLDIRDPAQTYSAAQFVTDATLLISAIEARGHLPLLTGGTMLYFKALFDGLDDMPRADATVRAQLEREAATQGWPALHAELARVDPPTAARLHPADSQRISRALEVYRICGQPLSAFQTHQPSVEGAALRERCRLISLEPQNRTWLHERIAQRFDAMLADGLLDEVAVLRARGDLKPDLPAMRSVGYRQAWDALDGKLPMTELRERGIFATRQLAKRQMTWLRAMRDRCVVAAESGDAQQQVLALAREWIGA